MLSIAMLLYSLSVSVNPAGSVIILMKPGQFHGAEIALDAGEHQVLALHASEGKSELKTETIHITMVRDDIYDREEGEETAKDVERAQPEPEAIVLFSQSHGGALKAGPVEQAVIGLQCLQALHANYTDYEQEPEDVELPALNEKPCNLALGEKVYDATLEAVSKTDDGNTVFVATMIFTQGEATTRLEQVAAILWAGDLDGDGMLDLLVDHSDHYNVGEDMRLYLSGRAAKGELVGEAATLHAVGC